MQELKSFGFHFNLVLADSLDGKSHPFVRLLDELAQLISVRELDLIN
jgi:hypothetical protein